MRSHIDSHTIDYQLLGLTIVLTVFGLIILTSASSVLGFERFQDTYYFTKQQLINIFLGAIGLIAAIKIPVDIWKRLAFPLFVTSLVMLVLVFLPGIGVEINNAKSWLRLGPVQFQPSEFAKLAFLLYLAVWFERRGDHVKNFSYGLLPFLVLTGVLAILIILEPDPGTVFIIIAISLGVFFVAGGRILHLIGLCLLSSVVVASLILSAPYRTERLRVFLNLGHDPTGVGYHINQAVLAIGSGGIGGKGLGHSRQKFSYLPEVAGDSIFAVMGEELGFIFTTGFIVLLTLLVKRLIDLAEAARHGFERYFIIGCALWIGIQSFVNMGAMMGLIPLTGLPLPFVSHGGTAMIALLTAMGICLGISRTVKVR